MPEGRFLVAQAGAQPQSLRKTFEQPELPPDAAPLPELRVALAQLRGVGDEAADELPDAYGKRIAVVGGCGKGDDASAVAALDERVVVEGVEDPAGPRAADVVLGQAAQRRKDALALFERPARDLAGDLGRGFRRFLVAHVETAAVPAGIETGIAGIRQHRTGGERARAFRQLHLDDVVILEDRALQQVAVDVPG